jgi:Family of unknown function (DUF6241)
LTWIKEHKLIVTSIVVILIFLGFLGVIFEDMINGKAATTPSSQSVSSDESASTPSQNTTTKPVSEITENPFGSNNLTLSEDEIQQYMHGMSHQKVDAKEKWVHIEMTDERIQFLIGVVEGGSYNNRDLYLDILNRWSEDDFSRADKDHNEIWKLQGGTIGEATGLLTAEEEQEYLEANKNSIQ